MINLSSNVKIIVCATRGSELYFPFFPISKTKQISLNPLYPFLRYKLIDPTRSTDRKCRACEDGKIGLPPSQNHPRELTPSTLPSGMYKAVVGDTACVEVKAECSEFEKETQV